MNNTVVDMIEEIRDLLVRYGHLPERVVYEALMDEASGWNIRLEELNEEEDG